MQLIIAEKPSVGLAIATALNVTNRKNGYMEGNGLIVSWCIGHLVSLANADSYNAQLKQWRYDTLPILPKKWKYSLSDGKKKQFSILKKLMERSNVSEIVNACDAGREGELIFRLVYEMAGCTKPVTHLWISSMEHSVIQKGFQNRKPSAEYEALYQSALCRSKADWLIGINATRLFSVLYNKTLRVGRVQTPTLAMLVERQDKISAFVKEKYYRVELAIEKISAASEKTFDPKQAEIIQTACQRRQAVCVSVEKEHKMVRAPKLFDLTTLQREANRIYGFTAKQTLDYGQSLYEKKLMTYPRTDSRYLTADMEETATAIVNLAVALSPFENIPAFAPRISALISDKEVSDHHAIIPTIETAKLDLSTPPVGERALFLLVCCKLLCAVAPSHEYETVTAIFECNGHSFTAKGKTIVVDGWKAIETLFLSSLKEKVETASKNELHLPNFIEGMLYEQVDASISEHFTTPPKPHTEDTLLSAMEHAGKEDVSENIERKGLGTPATRAGIIEKIVSSGFAQRNGKDLIPTSEGIGLISILPESLTSPRLTAEWEKSLSEIANGTANPSVFMEKVKLMITELVKAHSPTTS